MRNVLVLGGGSFVGGALARDALRRGWRVTCVSRGRARLPRGVRSVIVDRSDAAASTAALAGMAADLVVDTWSAAPRAVAVSATALAARCGRYGYISTRSVYASWPNGATESAPLVPGDPDAEASGYGADKRGAEIAAQRAFGPDRVLYLRAGAILGPGENYGRLPWWLSRLARGGTALAPGPAHAPLQYVDVRDLAAFVWDCLAGGRSGPVDVACRSDQCTMADLLTAARACTGTAAELCWVDAAWLLARGVLAWRQLPLWAPPGHPYAGLHTGDTSRARAFGLRCRPLAETVADTWASMLRGQTPAEPVVAGLGIEEALERRLLAQWAAPQ